MQKLFTFLSITTLSLLTACSGNKNKLHISGHINSMPEQLVILEQLEIQGTATTIDSAHSNAQGKFELKGTATESGLYRIRFTADEKFALLSLDKGSLELKGDWNMLENYQVAGSPPSESLVAFFKTFREYIRDIRTVDMILSRPETQANDSLLGKAMTDQRQMQIELTRFIEQYADTTLFLPNAIFAAQMLNPMSEQAFMQPFIAGLETRFPGAKMVDDFIQKHEEQLALINQQQQTNDRTPAIGSKAPTLKLPGINGKEISLSDYKGKYVLVDFWASWCGPCRQENPNVVAAYNQYSNKNFTVLGVSLDDNKSKWQQAVQKDGLSWDHISDLKRWESIVVRDFGIVAIPSNILVDPNGVIIARDLRGPALHNKLKEVLN